MKISEILTEAPPPYLHDGELQQGTFLDGSYSRATITREFKKIGEYVVSDTTVSVFIHKNNTLVVGVDLTKPTEADRLLPVFKLVFKDKSLLNVIPAELRGKSLLQINKVMALPEYRNSEMATTIYMMLANLGYAVISDTAQFETAQGLWKKLALLGKVLVIDLDYGAIKDQNDKTIFYSGNNIPDSYIWSSDEDFRGQNIVLCLVK